MTVHFPSFVLSSALLGGGGLISTFLSQGMVCRPLFSRGGLIVPLLIQNEPPRAPSGAGAIFPPRELDFKFCFT